MTSEEKEVLKNKILSRYELHNKSQGSKIKRVTNDPLRALQYFVLQSAGYFHPYTIKHKTLWGGTMHVCLPEAGSMYYYGFLEVNLSNFFINFFKEGDVFFDVGAHIGYYTRLVSSLVGDTGHVHGFEPTKRTFKILEKNTKGINNITIHNVAVLDKNSEIDFFDYGARHSVFNSFKPRTSEEIAFKNEATKQTVTTVDLDSFCEYKNISPTFIKIDAEGSEHLILKALDRVMSRDYPLVTIEVSDCEEWETSRVESVDFLSQKGYMCFEISLDGRLRSYTPAGSHAGSRGFDNLLFVHPKKLYRVQELID